MRIHERGHLSPAEREEILRIYHSEKISMRALAKRFRVSAATVCRLVKNSSAPPPSPPPSPPQTEPESSQAPVSPHPKNSSPAPDKIKVVKELASSPPFVSDETEPAKPETLMEPLQFREKKLHEVGCDIVATRLRGSVHVLPQLHRLHMQIYDELAQLKADQDELEATMSSDGVLSTILSTISRLPPLLRAKIQDELDGGGSKVVAFPDQAQK